MSVEFHNVVKRYGEATAVAGISFTVEAGTLVTLLGPSGCGKTTTLRMIAGLELPNEGRISIAGRDVTTLGATQRDVSMVFQSYALFPHMNVLENVCYGLRRSGQSREDAARHAREGLRQVGLESYEQRQPSELSGGQQQRVAVARALVLKPSVLLFDEPLSNLDARLRRQMREEIRELQLRLGLTVVYVTHDQQEAMAVSDRIIVMNAGRIEQQGSPRDLYERPATPFLARFMGESNPARGLLRRLGPETVRVRLGACEIDVANANAADGEATVAIRPEAIAVERPENGDTNSLAGTIARASYLGTHMEYSIDTAAGLLFATCPRVERPLAVGDPVALQLAPRGVIVVES
ncbi:MAG: ABC transporter ATP-binding protein [Reyranella sp.]|nr:ABC transporter ATP-binding protein [Reyranella sp.]MDP3161073.1 ABC transporter ATP-binding protein [Reyranella sp.]